MARTHAPAFSLRVGPRAASSLVVTRFSGSESLSRLYDFRTEFFEKDGQLLELPGTQALLTIQVGEAPARYVHGLVRQAELLGRIDGRAGSASQRPLTWTTSCSTSLSAAWREGRP